MPGEKAPNREGNQFGSFLRTIWEYHWVIIIIMIIMALVVMIGWYTFDYMPSPSLQISSAEELNRLWRRSPEPLFPPKSVIQTERTGSMHVDRRSRLRYQSLSYEVNCTSTLADGMLEIYEYDLNCVYWPGTTHIKNPYIDQPIPSRNDLTVATTISLSPPYIYPDPSLPEGTVQRTIVRTFTIGLYRYSIHAIYSDRYAELADPMDSADTLWILSRTDQVIDELLNNDIY